MSSPVVAVLDVGSNSVRLLVVRELSDDAFAVIDEERFDARLAAGQARDGTLSDEGIARGIEGLVALAQVAAAHHPRALTAVGTEALRRAPNAGTFTAVARARAGVEIRILSAEEEAFASFLGVANSTALESGHIVDLGGGSLELIQVEDRRMTSACSASLGAIYATERYFSGGSPSRREVRALRKAVRSELGAVVPADELYGVGGAVRNIARIIRARRGYPLRRLHGLELSRREVHRVAAGLVSSSPAARRRIPGVSPSRVDILPAAAVVIDEAMEVVGASSLRVSGQGLREGLAWNLIRGPEPLSDVRESSITWLAMVNGVNPRVASARSVTAVSLFDATAAAHGLRAFERGLLGAAARIVDIGLNVDYYNRERHAEYLVHSGDLHGFSHREIALLGSVVRCATSGTPDLTSYRDIFQPGDVEAATTLSALLGLAVALHRRGDLPAPFDVRLDGGELVIGIPNTGGEAEVLALSRQVKRAEGALGLRISLTERPSA